MGSSNRARHFYFSWQTESVSEIHIHPKYDLTRFEFDIALIRLETNQELQRNELWPICLPDSPAPANSYDGIEATVIGWGKIKVEEESSSATDLQKLQGTIIGQGQCQNSLHRGITPGGPKICFKSEGGAPCEGDSGGGMFRRTGNTMQLTGVCSLGPTTDKCMPGSTKVYTKVAHPGVLDWMRKTMGMEDMEELSMENCGVTRISETVIDKVKDKVKCIFNGRQCY